MNTTELAKELGLPVETVAAAIKRIERRTSVSARLESARAANTNTHRGLNWLDESALLASLKAYSEAVAAHVKARGADPYLSSSEDDVVAVGHESGYDTKETAGKILFDRRSGFEH